MPSRLSPAWRITALVVALLFAFTGGAVAKGRYDAQFARNSDKVDGKHAVAAGATVAKRRGKLVATSRTNGKLPGNIVGTVDKAKRAVAADDSARLGGLPPAALRSVTVPAQGAGTGGSAVSALDRVSLVPSGDGSLSYSIVVPPDHRTGDPVTVTLVYEEQSNAACSWRVETSGIVEDGESFTNTSWTLPDGTQSPGLVSVPAGTGRVQRATFVSRDGGVLAGHLSTFVLERHGDVASDNCNTVSVRGVLFRY